MDSTILTLIIVLVATILSLVIAIAALIKANKALKNRRDDNHIYHIAKDAMNRYMGFEGGQKIKSLVQEELAKLQRKQDDLTSVAQKPEPTVAPAGTETKGLETPIVAQTNEPQNGPVEITLPEPVTLFTGSYSTGVFRHITPAPDDKTVFTIYTESADANEGVLNIDESAFEKVVQTPDYLNNACLYSGAGIRLHIVQTGKVIKKNGEWKVIEPIIAEFN